MVFEVVVVTSVESEPPTEGIAMSDIDTICPFTLCSSRADVQKLTTRMTGRPNPGATGKPVGNGESFRAFFVIFAALLAVAADGPSDPLDPAANHTRVVVIQGGKDSDHRPIVALANPTGTKDPDRLEDTHQGILDRELMRQALLIAARDELGMATRDEVLGDVIAADATTRSDVELVTVRHTVPGRLSPAVIRRGEGANARTLFQCDLGDNNLPEPQRRGSVEIAEELSRKAFPTVLKQIGLDGKPNANRPDAHLPAGVNDRLSHLDYIDVFAAVRNLHEAMRTSGESPFRVAGLVRGYALLGLLTEHHWHPAHKVFKARALLYAQRLVAPTRKIRTDSGTALLPSP